MATVYKRKYRTSDTDKEVQKKNELNRLNLDKSTEDTRTLSHEVLNSVGNIVPNGLQGGRIGGLKDYPEFRKADGSINPEYNSSIWQDMATGGAMGAGMGNDPFSKLGGAVGGLIGGVFAKNIAGKKKYDRDVEQIDAHNERVIRTTQANERAESMRATRENQAKRIELAQKASARKDLIDKAKNDEERAKLAQANYSQAVADGNMEEAQMWAGVYATSRGLNYIPDDITSWSKTPRKIGRSMFQYYYDENQPSRVKVAVDETGKPILDLTANEYMSLVKNATKGKYDADKASESFRLAVEQVNRLEKDGSVTFKTANGKPNSAQRNTWILKIAGDIYEGMVNDSMPKTIDINGTSYSFDISVTPAQKAVENVSPTADPVYNNPNSSFNKDEPAGKTVNATSNGYNPVETYTKAFSSLLPDRQEALNKAIGELQEGEEQEVTLRVDGKPTKFVIKKVNGKNVLRIQ